METNRLRASLLLLRISIFVVMLHWTLDKLMRPEHASQIFENYYYISGLSVEMMYVAGAIELIILVGFVLGFFKFYTYGLVLMIHAISTILAFEVYFSPFVGNHLLFFTSWPMLAGCITLFLLRDEDTMCSF